MEQLTKLKLTCVFHYCAIKHKSNEYMYQLMQDVCEVDMDIISEYIEKENHEELINQIIGIVETIEILYKDEI
jgi:hypothetical protein